MTPGVEEMLKGHGPAARAAGRRPGRIRAVRGEEHGRRTPSARLGASVEDIAAAVAVPRQPAGGVYQRGEPPRGRGDRRRRPTSTPGTSPRGPIDGIDARDDRLAARPRPIAALRRARQYDNFDRGTFQAETSGVLESLLTNMLFGCSLLVAAGWVRETFIDAG